MFDSSLAVGEPVAVWVGLDTGVASTAICITNKDGAVIAQGDVATKGAAVHEFIMAHGPSPVLGVGMEACSTSVQIAKTLRAMNYPVSVYDAFQVRRFLELRKNKTDKNDARGIAEVTRLGRGFLVEVHLKSNECFAIRSKLVARHNVVKQRVSTETMIKSLLRLYGGRVKQRPVTADLFRRHVERQLDEIEVETGFDLRPNVVPLVGLSGHLRAEIARLEQEISDYAGSNDVCQRFTAIPGVSTITAVSFYSAIEDPTRFRRSTDVPAYLGLTPKIYRSGETNRSGGISKAGNVMTRSHLVTAATVLITVSKRDTALKRWGQDRAGAIGMSKARVAVARKLAIVMFNMWRNGTSFADEGADVV